MQLKENTTFHNRYQLIKLLGRGGFSEVWLATDPWTKLQIAIKVYAPGMGMDNDGLQVFSQELAGVFNLNHTNLLKPTHLDFWEGMPYLIMPYCSKGSLMKQIGKMSERQIWQMIHDVAAGLQYLHKNDIVHQDIKPDNILIDEAGNYMITDFGISTKARTTLRKSVIGGGSLSGGTMAYMGPERFSKQPAPTKASDIWSLGAMVFELLMGNVPFGEMGGGLQKSGAEVPDISLNVSDTLKQTIELMLALETWDRPTAERLVDMASAQLQIIPEQPIEVLQPNAPNGTNQVEPTTDRSTQRHLPSEPEPSVEDILNIKPEGATPTNPIYESLSVTPADITLPAEGGEDRQSEVTILSDSEWRASVSKSNVDWLHIRKKNGVEDAIYIFADKNKSGKTREGYVYVNSNKNHKTINITQTSLPKSNKGWLWGIFGFLIVLFSIVCIAKHYDNVERERANLSYQHSNAESRFDIEISKVQTTNIINTDINSLKNAAKALTDIRAIERNSNYIGRNSYDSKHQIFNSKANDMKSSLNRTKQNAWSSTDATYQNADKKLTQINEIINDNGL